MLKSEKRIFGDKWKFAHNGYFSDNEVSKKLISLITKLILESNTKIVTDLGGGTGYILNKLLSNNKLNEIKLLNIDKSDIQLAEIEATEIIPIKKSFYSFIRDDVAYDSTKLMLIARSILHYAGKSNLNKLLLHISSQLNKEEYFIHQSASFTNLNDAECLNSLYSMMNTGKWYTTKDILQNRLNESGFSVEQIVSAPPLSLTAEELSARYAISNDKMYDIYKLLLKSYGNVPSVINFTKNSFTAYLHYYIFVCKKK